MISRVAVLTLVLSGVTLAHPAAAIDVVVGSGPGTCTEAAFASAVTTVNSSGGTITFDCGGPATITLTSEKVFVNTGNPNLVYTIDGGGLITLSGGGGTRHLFHGTGTLNIQNITFSLGLAQGAEDDASGGAIRSEGAWTVNWPIYLNLTNVTFTQNATSLTTAPTPPFNPFSYGGGAVFTRFGIVTVTDCRFINNRAYNTAGGALHGRSSTINITRSVFKSNASTGGGFGGAIHIDGLSPTPTATGGTLQISTTSFTGNTTRNQGGALYFYVYPEKNESVKLNTVNVVGNRILDSSGTYLGTRAVGGGIAGDRGDVTILNSTVADNVAHSSTGGGSGGGISLSSSNTVSITNSTISGNRAEGPSSDATGGGMVVFGNSQPFEITHSTIAFNFADYTGGGITSQSNGTLTNTIIAGNDAAGPLSPNYDQCTATLTNGGGVLEFPANDPPCAAGRITSDPQLSSLAPNGGFSSTHLLEPGSPAIDAGVCVIATDQRGVARPQGAACDLGAVEVGEPPPPSTDFFTLDPCRVVDTRQPGPTGGAPLICGVEQVFTLTGGSCGVPAGAKAVAVNVTVAQPTGQGNLNVYPAFTLPPATSVVNYVGGLIRANNAVVPLNAAGQVAVRCAPTGTTHVVIDVNGYFQ
jgi:predicted outer membrane repeat protein